MDAYVYQYSIGGLLFFAGCLFAWRQGYMGLKGRGLGNLCFAILGLVAFMALQGYLQYAPMEEAPKLPYDGSYTPAERLGTNLDYGIMIGYFVAILAIGTWFGRGQTGTAYKTLLGELPRATASLRWNRLRPNPQPKHICRQCLVDHGRQRQNPRSLYCRCSRFPSGDCG